MEAAKPTFHSLADLANEGIHFAQFNPRLFVCPDINKIKPQKTFK